MKKIIYILILCGWLPAALSAPDISAVPAGARSIGMGGVTSVIVDDPSAAVHNPAGLAPINQLEFFSMSATTLQDVQYLNYGIAFPFLKNSVLGLTYLSRDVADIPLTSTDMLTSSGMNYGAIEYTSYRESIALLSYASRHQFGQVPFFWGANAKFFQKSILDYDQGNGSAFNFDLGLYSEPFRDLGIGLKLQNLLQDKNGRNGQGGMVWSTGESENVAQYAAIGLVNKTLYRNLTLALDFKKNLSESFYPLTTHFGAEWHPLDALFFRAGAGQYLFAPDVEDGGYNELGLNYSLGIGLNMFGFRLDYAYSPDKEVADMTTHYFSVSYVGAEPAGLPPKPAEPATVTKDKILPPQLELEYPTVNFTTTNARIIVSGKILNGDAYMVNGEEYLSREKIVRKQVDLSLGLNDVLIGTPAQPQMHKIKILRLAKYNDIAEEKDQDSIIAISTLGYMSGDYPGRFNPKRTVSRQEMAAVVVKINKYSDSVLRGILDETDVLSNRGILRGFPDGMIRADEKLTKGQLALVAARLLDLPLREADRSSIVRREHWADPAINVLAASGLYARNEFVPRDAPVTKAQLVSVLARLPQVNEKLKAMQRYEDVVLEMSRRNNNAYQDLRENSDLLLFEEAAGN